MKLYAVILQDFSDDFGNEPVFGELIFTETAPAGTAYVKSWVRLYDTDDWDGEAEVIIDNWSLEVSP